MFIIINSLVLIFLIICSITDIRTQSIPGRLLYPGLLIISFLSFFNAELSIGSRLAGLAVGSVFILISRLTEEAIGYGDSFILTALGLFLGISSHMKLIVVTFALLMVTSMILLIIIRADRHSSLPMLPFLTAGFVLTDLIHIL